MAWMLMEATEELIQSPSGFQYSNMPTNPPYHGGSIMDVRDGSKVYKSGRSTSMTTSVYHGLESVKLDRLQSKNGGEYHVVITWVYLDAVAAPNTASLSLKQTERRIGSLAFCLRVVRLRRIRLQFLYTF
ncbi:hypothetical protein PENPOL_c021G06687 [Penicillium polonicum]|uniref:Uncharacterized protein n=1 Tax=Penicillium polonicum TaxID=60169 RepID=A0A1V6N7T6_PENPO|nr:hypothetical protein PENPOL_c021G06687 [Penicillium polonicum]